MVNKIAFLFPGQGSQSIGMGKVYFEKSAKAKQLIEQADSQLGFSLSKIMFEGPEEKLKETIVTQPALFVTSAAALEILKEKGITSQWAAGHSLGEYSALYASGVLSFPDALYLVQERGRAMNEAAQKSQGSMAAVLGLGIESVQKICQDASNQTGEPCVAANYNMESQIVISGTRAGVKKGMELAQTAGAAKVIELNVSGAFHSPLMSPAVQAMSEIIQKTNFQDSSFPVITNVDALPTTRAEDFKTKLVHQIDHGVLWHPTLKKLIEMGAETFIEVGSGRVLSGMIKKLDRKKIVLSSEDFEGIDKLQLQQAAN
jgi:[acyl-carrier-protein] S-malonyltransferase